MKNKDIFKNILEKFDNIFLVGDIDDCITIIPSEQTGSSSPLYTTQRKQIKDFISLALSQQREEIIEMIEKKRKLMKPYYFSKKVGKETMALPDYQLEDLLKTLK